MAIDMGWIDKHKVLIVIVGGGALGVFLLMRGSSASSSGSSGSGTSGLSTATGAPQTSSGGTLGAYYGYQLQSQALSAQAQAASAESAAATTIGLAQAKVQNNANNLMALSYVSNSINNVLNGQNNVMGYVFGAQAGTIQNLGTGAYNPIARVNISTNQYAQSTLTGHFSGYGMNIGSGNNIPASG
jgi:hypothetical protein